jgi:hypothetical protein
MQFSPEGAAFCKRPFRRKHLDVKFWYAYEKQTRVSSMGLHQEKRSAVGFPLLPDTGTDIGHFIPEPGSLPAHQISGNRSQLLDTFPQLTEQIQRESKKSEGNDSEMCQSLMIIRPHIMG